MPASLSKNLDNIDLKTLSIYSPGLTMSGSLDLCGPSYFTPVNRILFLSPNFPPHFRHFISALHARGIEILAVGDSDFYTFPESLQSMIKDYIQVSSLSDYPSLYSATALLQSRHGKVDRIEGLNESWLEMEARLRVDFNCPGLTPLDLERMRSKLGMAEIFHTQGLAHPPVHRVTTKEKLVKFAERVSYPLILKPAIGVGASGTFKIKCEQDIDQVLHQIDVAYLAQPFVRGKIVTFDGIVDRQGSIVYHLSQEYMDGCMETLTEALDYSGWTILYPEPELVELGTKAVQALGLKERWFHLELFRLETPEIVNGHVIKYKILEANLRPPGVFMVDMMNWCSDVDLYETWVNVIQGKPNPLCPPGASGLPKHHVIHVGRRTQGLGSREYHYSHDELCQALGNGLLRYEWALPFVWHGGLGNECYVLRFTPSSKSIVSGKSITEGVYGFVKMIQAVRGQPEPKIELGGECAWTEKSSEVDLTKNGMQLPGKTGSVVSLSCLIGDESGWESLLISGMGNSRPSSPIASRGISRSVSMKSQVDSQPGSRVVSISGNKKRRAVQV